jgi:hypothetical protein
VSERTVHPYRDTDVIDSRAPRFNQATVALVSIVALATGWWGLFGVLAIQLLVGLTFGRQYCLPCVFYFEVVQPRIGEGPIEDSRPPRFANIVGAIFLTSATLAFATDLSIIGTVLGGMVAALATLAATTGLCVGCEIYRLIARLRGIRPGTLQRVDLSELDVRPGTGAVVQFTHPLCTDCHEVTKELERGGNNLVLVDVSKRPDLARKYQISVVPTAVAVTSEGLVTARLA